MEIIPVIDLKHGIVVHARRGERDRYQPLVTPYAASAEPAAVVAGLHAAFAARTFYIADLDAITGQRGQEAIVARLVEHFPQLRFWVDGGFTSTAALAPYLAQASVDLVIGSESMANLATFDAVRAAVPPTRCVLSLDRRGDALLGCAALFDDETRWPDRVIHMTLSRVGAASGPDLEGIATLCARVPRCAVYAAGGVRDDADLLRLEALGARGALVATALHERRISPGR